MANYSEKILLINPTTFFISDYYKDLYYHSIPNQLLQLSSFLFSKLSLSTEIIDLRFENELEPILTSKNLDKVLFRKKIIKILETYNTQEYSIVAILNESTNNYLQVKILSEMIKSHFPNQIVVVGGHHAKVKPYDYLDKKYPIDLIITGELENCFHDLLKNDKLHHIKKQQETKILDSRRTTKLDLLPFPDFARYLEKYPYKNHFTFELNMSKGCPFSCKFCRIINYDKKIRNFSLEPFLMRFKRLTKFAKNFTSIPKISFSDQTFNSSALSRKVLNYIIDHKMNEEIQFSCQTRIEMVDMNRKLLNLFKKANMVVGYGLESADKQLLLEMNKTSQPSKYIAKMKKIIQKYKEINEIYCRVNIICGFPGENPMSFQRTVNFIEKNAQHDNIQINPTLFSNDPATHVYKSMPTYQKKFGTKFIKEWWKKPLDPMKSSVLPKPSKNYYLSELLENYLEKYSRILRFFKKSSFPTLIHWSKYFKSWLEKVS